MEMNYKELQFEIPDTFHQMDAAELSQSGLSDNAEEAIFYDEERHTRIIIEGRQLNPIIMKTLFDSKKTRTVMQHKLKKTNPHIDGFDNCDYVVAGKKRSGYKYSFSVDGIDALGEAVIVDKGRYVYHLFCVYRKEFSEFALGVWEKLLASIK